MVAGVEQLIAIHVAEHLLEHGPLQHLAEDRQYCNWSIVLGVEFASFSLIEWHHLGNFSLGWELPALNRKVEDVADRRNNVLSCKLQNVSVKIINPTGF